MKGLTVPLTVVLTLVVILIVAVIVLVIFQSGLGPAVSFTEAESICRTSAATACSASGSLATSGSITVKYKDPNTGVEKLTPCSSILSNTCKCENKQLVSCS